MVRRPRSQHQAFLQATKFVALDGVRLGHVCDSSGGPYIGELASGGSARSHFRFNGNEMSFELQCRKGDGTEIHEYEGYLVWEVGIFGIDAKLVILPKGEPRVSPWCRVLATISQHAGR